MDRHEEVVRNALSAFGRRDLEGLAALLTDDIAWHTPGDNLLSGDYQGRTQVLAYLAEALSLSADSMRVEPVDILVGRDHVAALVDVSGERAGRVLRDRSIQLFRIRDGRIAERRVYPADQRATDEFWSR